MKQPTKKQKPDEFKRITRPSVGPIFYARYGRSGKFQGKGYIPYDTRTLINKITRTMDRSESSGNGRVCYINQKWRLQVRGKHLRRLLKKMPGVVQKDNCLVDET